MDEYDVVPWNIAFEGQNNIIMRFLKDEKGKTHTDFINFDIQYQGESFNFYLWAFQAEELIHKLTELTEISRAARKARGK